MRNAQETDHVIAALHEVGVAAGDIRADLSSISPVYAEDGQAIIGYRVENAVTAAVHDVDRAGPAIDAAVRAGASPVRGPVLSSPDRAALAREAMQAAFADACAKADTVAAAAAVGIGDVVSVTEEPGNASAKGDRIEARVTVTFEIA